MHHTTKPPSFPVRDRSVPLVAFVHISLSPSTPFHPRIPSAPGCPLNSIFSSEDSSQMLFSTRSDCSPPKGCASQETLSCVAYLSPNVSLMEMHGA